MFNTDLILPLPTLTCGHTTFSGKRTHTHINIHTQSYWLQLNAVMLQGLNLNMALRRLLD